MSARGTAASEMRPAESWIWPYRPSCSVSIFVFRFTSACAQVFETRWWPVVCLAIGAGPAWFSYALGAPGSHLVTAVMATSVLLGACLRDDFLRGTVALALIVVALCVVNVSIAATDPDRLAKSLPAGARYWEESRTWIVTGENPEYELGSWAPAHLRLVGGVGVLGYVSLGVTPLRYGLEQVDMMNFYVGRLIAHSHSPLIVAGLGWHPWSICRGIGCLVLIFEVVSLSLQRLTGRQLCAGGRRRMRWAVGVGFLILDGVVKYTCMETVRSLLAENLIV